MWREERKLSGIFNWCLALPVAAEADSPATVGRGGDARELAGVTQVRLPQARLKKKSLHLNKLQRQLWIVL